ncbi:hypothetical protein SH139x_002411 [Planctomycetaceae bacterium SH139]
MICAKKVSAFGDSRRISQLPAAASRGADSARKGLHKNDMHVPVAGQSLRGKSALTLRGKSALKDGQGGTGQLACGLLRDEVACYGAAGRVGCVIDIGADTPTCLRLVSKADFCCLPGIEIFTSGPRQ